MRFDNLPLNRHPVRRTPRPPAMRPRCRHPRADDQHLVSALRVHAFTGGARPTVVMPRTDRPGGTARLAVHRGSLLRVTTASQHPWRLRIGGPDGTVHTHTARRATTDVRHED
ncbi:hypothetical protein ACFZBP_21185 [Streptomyces sp. NPDC008086]|uniref:hypothetical protein n=1 Tax=Streptomyces sp. NPDC008086 TaxID=3364807 RepID=UPI0036F0E302